MKVACSIVLAFCCSLLPVTAIAAGADKASAEGFFNKYVELGGSYDVAVAALYADTAVITALSRYPDGREERMELTGTEWKGFVPQAMPMAKAQGDKSTFKNIEITINGQRAEIRAERYSQKYCYTDKEYYIVIELQADGEYRIVREHSVVQPLAGC